MSSSDTPVRHEIYVPGYRLPKLILAAVGLLLIILAMTKLGTVFRLAVVGETVRAEAVRVVLIDAAGVEKELTENVDVLEAEKRLTDAKDRTTSFWIDYRFTTGDGRQHLVRSPIGHIYKPLHAFRDADGLPAMIKLWVDPADPKTIVIPFQTFPPGTLLPFGFGTFFLPGMFLLFGCAGFLTGLVLWKNANKPIELPDLSQAHGEKAEDEDEDERDEIAPPGEGTVADDGKDGAGDDHPRR